MGHFDPPRSASFRVNKSIINLQISSNFVVFLENLNFTQLTLQNLFPKSANTSLVQIMQVVRLLPKLGRKLFQRIRSNIILLQMAAALKLSVILHSVLQAVQLVSNKGIKINSEQHPFMILPEFFSVFLNLNSRQLFDKVRTELVN